MDEEHQPTELLCNQGELST
ncbi:hypothetical protein A2U01_0089623, partial [Trifolium medium]|nr:hypothetical protein [Trifolium medium]